MDTLLDALSSWERGHIEIVAALFSRFDTSEYVLVLQRLLHLQGGDSNPPAAPVIVAAEAEADELDVSWIIAAWIRNSSVGNNRQIRPWQKKFIA